MPALEQMDRHDPVVVWGPVATDRHGRKTVGTPRQLMVRWDDTIKDATNPQGETIAIDVMLSLGEDVQIGSYVWQGLIGAWNPASHDGDVYVVTTVGGGKDLKGRSRFTRRTAGLIRHGKNLPVATAPTP